MVVCTTCRSPWLVTSQLANACTYHSKNQTIGKAGRNRTKEKREEKDKKRNKDALIELGPKGAPSEKGQINTALTHCSGLIEGSFWFEIEISVGVHMHLLFVVWAFVADWLTVRSIRPWECIWQFSFSCHSVARALVCVFGVLLLFVVVAVLALELILLY